MTSIRRKTQKLAFGPSPAPFKGCWRARVATSGLGHADAAPVVVMDAARGGKHRCNSCTAEQHKGSPGAEPGGADRQHMFYLENAH